MTEKYFGYMPNDFVNGENVSVSLWTAGCPHHCPGCHNQEMWDYNSGFDVPENIDDLLVEAIQANGIIRNFSVLGGEPLSKQNIPFVNRILTMVRENFPSIKIFLWTGSTVDVLQKLRKTNTELDNILKNVDVLIDGPYIQEKRDISLKLRGSTNQHILYNGIDF